MTPVFRRCLTVCALLFSIVASAPAFAEIASPPGPAAPAPADPNAIVPEDIILPPQTVAFVMGKGKWDDAATLFDASFKAIYAALVHDNIHVVGVPMVEYLDSDDSSFSFKAMVPVEATPGRKLASDVEIGAGPEGKVLKFSHRGSFDDLEQVYNRIDDYLAGKGLEIQRVVEEYVTDQAVTPPNNTVTNIYVFTN
jgi:effector-binding domain-containing protein